MKHFIYLSVIFLVTMLAVSFSKEIKSTEKVGEWFSPETWVGGEIPSKKDDVFINGIITSNKPIACNNLTINKSGNLILNSSLNIEGLISGKLTIYGCFEISETTSVHIIKSIENNSYCFRNLGTITIENRE